MSSPAVPQQNLTVPAQALAISSGHSPLNSTSIGVSSKVIKPDMVLKRTAIVLGVVCIASITIAAMVGTMGVGLLPVAAVCGAISAGTLLGGLMSWAGYVSSLKGDSDDAQAGSSHLNEYGNNAAAYQAALAAMPDIDPPGHNDH